MKTLNVRQGTPEWHEVRDRIRRVASMADAMMGVNKNVSRTKLLYRMATGDEQQFSAWVQENVINPGHEYEALARPIAEKIIGEELYPVTVADDDEYILASLDGKTCLDEITFEHKRKNAETEAAVKNGVCPAYHYWQVVQGLAITGAQRCLFMASNGTEESAVWCWVERNEVDIAKLYAGWKQFDIDLSNYQHVEVIPAAVAEPIKELPALSIEISGSVVASNLAQWRGIVTERIEAINTDLKTDQDFADADKMVKFLDEGEKRIEVVKAQAQSQATSIDEVFRALDEIKASMRAKRLSLGKLVEARKESIRAEICAEGIKAFAERIAALNKRIGKPYMPTITADFPTAMKGKKTVASLRSAVADLLAQKTIEANQVADNITLNLRSLAELSSGHEFLFSDERTIVLKANDDLIALAKTRIAEHKAAEERRIDAEREKIRAEEEAKAQAKVRAEQKAARQEDARIAHNQRIEAERLAAAQKKADDEAAAKTMAPIIKAEIAARSSAPVDVAPIALLLDLIDAEIRRMNQSQLEQALAALRSINDRQAA